MKCGHQLKFRSKLEKRISVPLLKCGYKYEDSSYEYTSIRAYTPDFNHPTLKHLLVEVKGRFKDTAEARKYVDFIDSNPHMQIVFIFANPNTPMPRARRRRDGTIYTHAEWATKYGFRYYGERDIEQFIKDYS